MPRWPWSKKKKPTRVQNNRALPNSYETQTTGFGQNAPKRTWAQWLNRAGPWSKKTRKAVPNRNLRNKNELRVKLAPGPRPVLTRKRAQSEPNFNYANLNWLKGNKPQTRGRKHTPIPTDFNNWSSPVVFPPAGKREANAFFESKAEPVNFGTNNINLITFPKNNKNKRNKAANKIKALFVGHFTRKAISPGIKLNKIEKEIDKLTPENIDRGLIIREALNELTYPSFVKKQYNIIKEDLLKKLHKKIPRNVFAEHYNPF